jgi:hypothetical protein
MLSRLSCTCSNSSATAVDPGVSSESDSELEDVRFMTSESSMYSMLLNVFVLSHSWASAIRFANCCDHGLLHY